jgi:hypothetical protein
VVRCVCKLGTVTPTLQNRTNPVAPRHLVVGSIFKVPRIDTR